MKKNLLLALALALTSCGRSDEKPGFSPGQPKTPTMLVIQENQRKATRAKLQGYWTFEKFSYSDGRNVEVPPGVIHFEDSQVASTQDGQNLDKKISYTVEANRVTWNTESGFKMSIEYKSAEEVILTVQTQEGPMSGKLNRSTQAQAKQIINRP